MLNRNEYEDRLANLKKRANALPLTPGVYFMKDAKDNIIYIGKAKALKNRVTQYFGGGNQHTQKVRQMVSNIADFEVILCDSEFEALLLENSMIKQHQPKYNILLKDDKGYHYIRITDEKWPRIETAMQMDKKGEYIGPYYSAFVVRETVEEVRRIFRLPDCSRNLERISKPCLNFHINLCDAPCRGKITAEEYGQTVFAARDFIKQADRRKTVKILKEEMERAAERLDFEHAARLRDRVRAIEKIGEKQKVLEIPYKRQDVFATASIGEMACVSVMVFREKRLCDRLHYFVDGFRDRASLYAEFLGRYYEEHADIPPRILLDEECEDTALLERFLSEKAGRQVHLLVPKQGEQYRVVDLCLRNAAENLAQKTERSGREMTVLNELADLLGLPHAPRRIEAYDISHTAGRENVAGMVVFEDGRPKKSDYRRFKIKGFSGQDDYRSMAEVLSRRLEEYRRGTEGFSVLPDLILLDGGKGQVAAVQPVLEAYDLQLPLFGMVKDSKHRTRAVTGGGEDIAIRANRRAFTFVTQIQDEVHRFAIGYHQNRRTKAMLSSELMNIEGVGKARAAELLKHFGTLAKLKTASKEEISAVKGVSNAVAEKIFSYFHPEGK